MSKHSIEMISRCKVSEESRIVHNESRESKINSEISLSEDEQLSDDGFELLSMGDESCDEASDSEIITSEVQNSEETVIFYHNKVLNNCSKKTMLEKKHRVPILTHSKSTSTEYCQENPVEPSKRSKKKITPKDVKNFTTNKKVEDELFAWISQNQTMKNPATYLNIRKKVMMLNKNFNGPPHFVPNSQWFRIFAAKYNLIKKTVNRERRSTVDFLKPIKYAKSFQNLINKSGYDLDRIYSAHKACICWNPLSYITKSDIKHENVCQHKVTLIICSNFSGNHKIPILVVGNSDDTDFSNDLKQLSIVYRSKPNISDISEEIFIDWYQSLFLPALREKYKDGKCFLLLNKNPTSPSMIYLNELDEMCQVQYLSPEFSSKVQLVQQRITLFIKRYFKKYVIREVLLFQKGFSNFCKSWNLIHALKGISSAWNSVGTVVLHSVWSELLQEDHKFEYNLICSALDEMSTYIYKAKGFHKWTENGLRKWLEDDLPDSCRNQKTRRKQGEYEVYEPSDRFSLLRSAEVNIISSDGDEEILIYR